jgi:hypothetical protein
VSWSFGQVLFLEPVPIHLFVSGMSLLDLNYALPGETMTSPICRNLIISLIGCSCLSCSVAQDVEKPLSDCELLALAAANALSENIVLEIEMRGLAFRPDETYRSELTAGGGDAHVLAALGKATPGSKSTGGEKNSSPGAAPTSLQGRKFDSGEAV